MFFNRELDIVERSDSSGLHGHDPSPKLTPQNLWANLPEHEVLAFPS